MEERFKTFTVQIGKISRSIRKIKEREMAEFNLKSHNVSCLYYLYKQKDGLTAKQLCGICDEDKAAISRSVEALEAAGYVVCDEKREKRYNSLLVLSDKGKKLAKQIVDKIDKIVDLASDGLSDNDRMIFYRSLMIITANLEKISKDEGR